MRKGSDLMAVSFVRTLIVFVLLLTSTRIMGKRQLGEVEPIELVTAVLISNLASQPLSDIGIPLSYGVVPVLTLLAVQLLISQLTVRSKLFSRLISGEPSIIIRDGALVENEMKKNRISRDEILISLRRSGVKDLTTVKEATLEIDGTLSVIPYNRYSPVTPDMLGLEVEED